MSKRMLLPKRMMLAAVCTRVMFFTKPALAEDNVRTLFEQRNAYDAQLVRKERQQELLDWDAVKGDQAFVDINEDLQTELSYMKIFYIPPLTPKQKILTRNTLLRLYENEARTQNEKDCLVKIMNYYGLFE